MAKKTSSAGKVAAGLGVAALAAAAAATYYFNGPKGKAHRKSIGTLGKKAKSEMLQKIKEMQTVSKQAYEQAAKEVLAKYQQAKNVKPEELMDLGMELKQTWDKISKDVVKMGASKKPAAKKKTAAKKTSKK